MSFRIGITDYVNPPFDVELEAFPGAEFVYLDSENELDFDPGVVEGLDALIVWHAGISEYTAKILSRAKIVVRYGVGFDNIDIKALEARDIAFSNTPDYGTEEVADTSCAMILNLQRKVSEYDFACRYYQGGWQEHVLPPLKRTSRQTLGVLGVGRIGTAVALRMKAFGYKLIGFDPYVPSGHEKAVGYERYDDLSEFLSCADVVTVHCPLTSETRGMINQSFIEQMRPGAKLVVTSRGGIIGDLECLENALKSNHLSGVALDVLPTEPPDYDLNLIKPWVNQEAWLRGRLLINPHSSYYSEDALYEMRYKASETARICLEKGVVRNQIVSS